VTADAKSFLAVLEQSNDEQLVFDVVTLFNELQWLLQYSHEEAAHYLRLCSALLAAKSPANLRNLVQAVAAELMQLQQQEAAAAAAAYGAGCNQSSASAADASAAATAAAFAEDMADAVPQPDTPGLYASSSNGVFGCEPNKAWLGSSGSSMAAAAESAPVGDQYSHFSELPDQTNSSSNSYSWGCNSSNTAAFGFDGQNNSGLPEPDDSSPHTWEQAQQQSLFVGTASWPPAAGGCGYATPGVFGSSSMAAAAQAGDVLTPNTFSSSSCSSSSSSSSSAARRSWGSQHDSGLYDQLSSSSSSSSSSAAVSSMPAPVQDPPGASGNFDARGMGGASCTDGQAAAAAAEEDLEVSGDGGSSSSSRAEPRQSGRAKVLRCLAVCALVSVRCILRSRGKIRG
jgi:hypothetical protein